MNKFYLCLIGLLLGLNMSYAQTNMSSEMYELAKMKEENNDLQMQIVKLETEMKNRRR